MSRVWVVRAGRGGSLIDLARTENLVFIGWPEIGDLSAISSGQELESRVETVLTAESKQSRAISTGQLRHFRFTIAEDDLVIAPGPSGAPLEIGRIAGPCTYRPDLPDEAQQTRAVEWIGQVSRSDLGQDLQNTLGSLLTVFQVKQNQAEERLSAILAGEEDPGKSAATKAPKKSSKSKTRYGPIVQALLQVLASASAPMPRGEVLTKIREVLPPNEFESQIMKSGVDRFTNAASYHSIDLDKAGWLVKGKEGWLITDEGREALAHYTEADELLEESRRLYFAWKEEANARAQEAREREAFQKVIGRIPHGRWATLSDAGKAAGVTSSESQTALLLDKPNGWFRILPANGVLGGEASDTEQRQLLNTDGLEFEDRAPADRRLNLRELRGLLSENVLTQRAWLIRGSNVSGTNLIPTWIEEGFVSLPGTTLQQIDMPVERQEVVSTVSASFANRPADYRRRKIDDYDRVLRQMQPGDYVLTSADGLIYAGTIQNEAYWDTDTDLPARVRRGVDWLATEGVPFLELPEVVAGRLSSNDDVSDLSTDLKVLEKWIDELGSQDDPEEVESLATAAHLNEPQAELSDELFMDLQWLVGLTRTLNRRKQAILYGPPGTGKTYLARMLAEHWTDPENITLVQFHPSVTYEDFIAGYRPVKSEDGNVAFEVRPGPFMRLAERARDNPSTPHILIIDEINRANLAKVFGELYFLLEYRNAPIEPLYADESSTKFTLPANVFIIGTMNTADRSIALVDAAMRRRFAFLEMHPAEYPVKDVLRRWLMANSHSGESAELLEALNDRIPFRDFAIGPSYFMKHWIHEDDEGLAEVWETDLLPLLEEHHAGENVDIKQRYGLSMLRSQLEPKNPEVDSTVEQELGTAMDQPTSADSAESEVE
jgi:5-methylcytosine-specific restriction protein B